MHFQLVAESLAAVLQPGSQGEDPRERRGYLLELRVMNLAAHFIF